MLDAVQAGACGIHPAGEDPLHLALQRDLVDLDKGVGVGGFGGRAACSRRSVFTRSAPNCTVSPISSSKLMMRPVILSSPEKLAFLLVILVAGGSDTTSSPGCKVAGVCGTRSWAGVVPAAIGSAWPGGALATPGPAGPPGCGGCDGDARLGVLRNDGGTRRRRQRLRLHAARSAARPAPAADGSASATAGRAAVPALPRRRRAVLLRLVAARDRSPAAAAADRKKYCRSARARAAQARLSRRRSGPQNQSGQWFETSRAALKGESGSRHSTKLIRRSRGLRLTRRIRRGKGGFPPSPATGQPAPQMK